MVIDFHTHAFPDAIAGRTLKILADTAGETPCHDGTVSGLCRLAKAAGVDRSVVLPVVTAPRQFDSINRFAAEHNGEDGLCFFGGIHPEMDDPEARLREIKALRLKGIKIHPDYQEMWIGDERYIRLIRHALSLGLTVVTHAGRDPLSPDRIHADVEGILRLLEGLGGAPENLVLAHLGGEGQLEEVERRLCGAPVYLDLSHMLDRTPAEQVMRLIRRHGADRILFATDSPWDDPGEFLRLFADLPLTEEERQKILWRNAAALLDL